MTRAALKAFMEAAYMRSDAEKAAIERSEDARREREAHRRHYGYKRPFVIDGVETWAVSEAQARNNIAFRMGWRGRR